METQGAYGAGRAGAPFNPITFIKKPQVIVRLIALVSSTQGSSVQLLVKLVCFFTFSCIYL